MVSTPTVARPQAEETESVEPDSDDPENMNQEQAVMKTRKEQSLSNN